MSDRTKQTEAQQREMPEPYEGNRPVPWLVILIVSGVFIWAVSYIWFTHRTQPPSYGDYRTAVDFKVAAPSATGKVDGGQIYAAQCVACHQANGQGLPGVFPPLAGSEWVTGKAGLAVQIVLHGVTGELTVAGTTYQGMMPTFKDKLDDAQIAAVVSYIRSNFGNTADQVDTAAVATERAATADREAPWHGDTDLAGMK